MVSRLNKAAGRPLHIRAPLEDKVFYAISYTLVGLFALVVLYPIIFVVSASFSSGIAVTTGQVMLWPVDVSLEGYRAVFSHRRILGGFRNTVLYTAAGTLINVCMTFLAAYPLSRHDMQWRKGYMWLFTFTLFFSGGLIPTYILISKLRMVNTIWAVLIPGAISVYNMIVTRTFIQNNIPREMLESAMIDGCSDARYFFTMVLPLSNAVIAVITLFYAVGHWNSYFSAMIYLNDLELQPLQLILRDILIKNQINSNEFKKATDLMTERQNLADQLKYALIVISSVPIIMVYPFVQRYFIQGVMIGSIKG